MTESYDGRRDADVHGWFELSYAKYLTIPRSILQSMPVEWQKRFVACLQELDDALPWRPAEGRYWVQLKDASGRYVEDPFDEYRHAPIWTAEMVGKARLSQALTAGKESAR
jgi:hypothetical protein